MGQVYYTAVQALDAYFNQDNLSHTNILTHWPDSYQTLKSTMLIYFVIERVWVDYFH